MKCVGFKMRLLTAVWRSRQRTGCRAMVLFWVLILRFGWRTLVWIDLFGWISNCLALSSCLWLVLLFWFWRLLLKQCLDSWHRLSFACCSFCHRMWHSGQMIPWKCAFVPCGSRACLLFLIRSSTWNLSPDFVWSANISETLWATKHACRKGGQ